jgi:endonuclease/exonuclease/phosphatase family metal-dependent hydrolase
LKKAVKKTLLILNGIFAGSLLLTYLSVYISPEDFWLLAFFGLTYRILLLINLLMIILWIIRKNKFVLISLITILLGSVHIRNFIQIPVFEKSDAFESVYDTTLGDTVIRQEPVAFLSYNVRLFDYYQWSDNPAARDMIIDLIADRDPGILCLQEIYTPVRGKISSLSHLDGTGTYGYAHIAYATGSSLSGKYGIATLSVFPIVNRGELRFSGTYNLAIFTDLKIHNDTIRVYNTHLQSIRLRKREYDLLKMLNSGEEAAMDEIKDISTRLKYAFQKRAHQAEILAGHIRESPWPVIVCGDFNDTPVSYTYHKIRGDLMDAFIESGRGIGNTYSGMFPSYRIDYILHSRNLKSMGFETVRVDYSDHFPVSCWFGI